MGKKRHGNFRRVAQAKINDQLRLLGEQAEKIAELEKRVAELEARPVYPYYPIVPCDPPNPWIWPAITWTWTISSTGAAIG